jgi:hypothetical protein
MGPLIRALTYGTLFVGLVLVFVPARLLEWSGATSAGEWGLAQVAGVVVGLLGAGLAVWCILTFPIVGRGTPAPFDPPSPTRSRWALPLDSQPDVQGSWAGLGRGSPLLQIALTARLSCRLPPRHPSLRAGVRGAHTASAVRRRLRGVH